MRFTKEFKLECVKKYKLGEEITDPGGCKHKTFFNTVRTWVRIFDAVGEAGLEHKTQKRTWEDKMVMIERVLNGESLSEVACSNGTTQRLLSKWYKIYKESGVDGLKLDRRGRHIKMAIKIKKSNKQKTNDELEKEIEYLRAENEYLKKLNALVQERKGQQQKKK